MANRLSDDELRKSLQDYGEDVGPITPTTRSIWEKKLLALRKTNGPATMTRALNAFSSDDSEIESAVANRVRKKRTFNRNESNVRSERMSLIRPREINSSPGTDVFKKPSPVHIMVSGQDRKAHFDRPILHRNQNTKSKTKKNFGKQTTFDVETSDSDFDTESPFMSAKSARLRKKTSNVSSDYLGMNLRKLNEDGTKYENSVTRKPLNSHCTSDTEHSLHHFSTTLNRLKREHIDPGYRTNGYLPNTISNGEFHEEKVQGSSTNYSHCVSWLLVVGVVAFFVLIGALYMTEVQKTTQTANKSHSKFCSGVNEEQCKMLILISQELHHLLTTVAGEYECDSSGIIKNRNLTVPEAREILKEQLSKSKKFEAKDFDSLFNHSVKLITEHPDCGLKLYSLSGSGSELTQSKDPAFLDYSALEATHAAKSFWCRVRHSVRWTATKLFFIVMGIFTLIIIYYGAIVWKRRRELQEKMFYEMVEKVIDILQDSQDSSYQSDSNLGPYKAVVNVRDTLIPAKERKDKLWLWDKVVAFIEENESRVSVEYKTINGEDFKVWRWNPCTTSEQSEGSKQGKVWQGQAFNSLGKGKNPTYSPTPCLKIRNMFDSEVEYGDDWQISIQDAILEKCEGNDGIKHIAVDTSSNEGCVYMLCSSTEAAGKAFNALHGWWFDGKLVTVKYLRYERYLERFPEAENCVEPLKPSNNKRLSLSTPFFSSALERS